MIGRSWSADLLGCTRNLTGRDAANQFLDTVIHLAGMKELKRLVHTWDGTGREWDGAYTAVSLVEESHVAVHTWPDRNYAFVDVYTCNGRIIDPELLKMVKDFFGALTCESTGLCRGIDGFRDDIRNYRITRVLDERVTSRGVYCVVADTVEKGVSLFLNGERQSSATDTSLYHQSLVWAGAAVCGRPIRRVLLAGCGEGVALHYLKPLADSGQLDHVDWVDYDHEVMEVCARHMPFSPGLDAPEWCTVRVEEIGRFLDSRPEPYDLVLWDLPEMKNGGGSDFLYTGEVFSRLADNAMTDRGVLVVEANYPLIYSSGPLRSIYHAMKETFGVSRTFIYSATEIEWSWVVGCKGRRRKPCLDGCLQQPVLTEKDWRYRTYIPPALACQLE